jgi:hypothetical protein
MATNYWPLLSGVPELRQIAAARDCAGEQAFNAVHHGDSVDFGHAQQAITITHMLLPGMTVWGAGGMFQ